MSPAVLDRFLRVAMLHLTAALRRGREWYWEGSYIFPSSVGILGKDILIRSPDGMFCPVGWPHQFLSFIEKCLTTVGTSAEAREKNEVLVKCR